MLKKHAINIRFEGSQYIRQFVMHYITPALTPQKIPKIQHTEDTFDEVQKTNSTKYLYKIDTARLKLIDLLGFEELVNFEYLGNIGDIRKRTNLKDLKN